MTTQCFEKITRDAERMPTAHNIITVILQAIHTSAVHNVYACVYTVCVPYIGLHY